MTPSMDCLKSVLDLVEIYALRRIGSPLKALWPFYVNAFAVLRISAFFVRVFAAVIP
jgi:hypothetical protein